MTGREVYGFGEFKLDAPERRLSRNGQPIPLAPKTYDVLLALIRNAGRLVTKRELLDLVWPDAFVEEGILAVHTSMLRKALGDDEGGRRYIETIPRSGYRFVAPVQDLAGDGVEPARQSVAILPARPFLGEILSSQDRSTGLAIADALIDRLGRSREIIVRPARAVQAYVNAEEDPASIGRALHAGAVIDTRFVATGDRIRIAISLIRSHDGALLWTGNFDKTAAEVIMIADPVAESVAAQLGPRSPESPTPRQSMRAASNAKVYELFGRGRFHLLSSSVFEVPKAVEAFKAAIELDPAYAPAHAGLAMACCTLAAMRVVPPAEAYAEARRAALNALAMDDSSADAQAALGAVMFFSEWNWVGAEKSLQRALDLNPNHSEAYLIYGQLLDALGRLEDGLRMKLRALERDPFSPLVHLQISLSYWNQRRYDEAIEWAGRALQIDPGHPHAREHLAAAYLMKGDVERYMAENVKHAELHHAPPEMVEELKRVFAEGGYHGIIKSVLRRAESQPRAFPAMQLALFYGVIGDMDAAFRYLGRAIDDHDPSLVHLAVSPQWDCLGSDPRFDACLARMALTRPHFIDAAPTPP